MVTAEVKQTCKAKIRLCGFSGVLVTLRPQGGGSAVLVPVHRPHPCLNMDNLL